MKNEFTKGEVVLVSNYKDRGYHVRLFLKSYGEYYLATDDPLLADSSYSYNDVSAETYWKYCKKYIKENMHEEIF